MSSPIVIADCETTGLHRVLDDIWEFAAIRRDPGAPELQLHLFIEHEEDRCARLPEPFLTDHAKRWPLDQALITPADDAAFLIDTFFRGPAGSGRAHLVGAVPSFDEQRLWQMLGRHLGPDWREPWHYHLIDCETLAVGYLRGRYPDLPFDPPWDSDVLTETLGIPVDHAGRHTAMGDVRWAARIYDRVMKGL